MPQQFNTFTTHAGASTQRNLGQSIGDFAIYEPGVTDIETDLFNLMETGSPKKTSFIGKYIDRTGTFYLHPYSTTSPGAGSGNPIDENALQTLIDSSVQTAVQADIADEIEQAVSAAVDPISQTVSLVANKLVHAGVPNWASDNDSVKVLDTNGLGHKYLFEYLPNPEIEPEGLTLKPFLNPVDDDSNQYWTLATANEFMSWDPSLGPYLRPEAHFVIHQVGNVLTAYKVISALLDSEHETPPESLPAKYEVFITRTLS